MKKINKIIAVTLISGGLLGGAIVAKAHSRGDYKNEVAAVKDAPITMISAVEIALAKIPGTPKEAEFEIEDGKSIWEVEVVNADQQVYELEIDANSGEILKQKLDDGKRKHRKKRKQYD